MARGMCPFHTDDDVAGQPLEDGACRFSCDRSGHPGGGPWHWLEVPASRATPEGLTGLADELDLQSTLPRALESLGEGWFEYGLVERAYAEQNSDEFRQMVERWGHTAIKHQQHTVSSYLAGCLGRLSALGYVAYRPGRGTGRWSYNTEISWWATTGTPPEAPRTAWVDVVGDRDPQSQDADQACRAYVPGA